MDDKDSTNVLEALERIEDLLTHLVAIAQAVAQKVTGKPIPHPRKRMLRR